MACKDWHHVPEGLANWIRVDTLEEGRYPDLKLSFLVQCCYNCAKPSCLEICQAQAIKKREDNGLVVVDPEACLGKDRCGLCSKACPYDAPQFGAEENAKMQKCDLCLERVTQGQQPICVEACPMWALDFGPLDQLKAKHGDVNETVGFAYALDTRPAIIFKPKVKPGEFL